MLDISLTKLLVIGLVALIVIGPERLPRVARKIGTIFGRTQSYINQIKNSVDSELRQFQIEGLNEDFTRSFSLLGNESARAYEGTERQTEQAPEETISDVMEFSEGMQVAYEKNRSFRKARSSHHAAIPAWYRRQNKCKQSVVQGMIRISRYRNFDRKKFPSFYG